ncbi:MAG TPA: methylated-DNA--[protein]-cysteine S-methyltransferase [Paraburkholderia sp.]|jgi:methylated-DNA-[protein]-cysteine S-methyltransferase
MKHCTLMPSPLGDILLRAEDDALTGLFFVGQKYFPTQEVVGASVASLPVLHEARDQLGEYFAGERRTFTVRVRPAGTAFQRSVWDELMKIPYGHVESYGGLAQRLGLAAGSARAVGAANGRNPVSIILPCHRVISGAGDLTGYAGGLARKEALLALERPASAGPRQLELLDAADSARTATRQEAR